MTPPEPPLSELWRFLRANPVLLALIIAVLAGCLALGVTAARQAYDEGLWDVPADASSQENGSPPLPNG